MKASIVKIPTGKNSLPEIEWGKCGAAGCAPRMGKHHGGPSFRWIGRLKIGDMHARDKSVGMVVVDNDQAMAARACEKVFRVEKLRRVRSTPAMDAFDETFAHELL